MKTLKSILAVLAGFIAIVILHVGTDLIFERFGIFPPASQPMAYEWWMLLIALAYRTVWTILGGFLTAKLAPSKPMKHVMALGIIGTLGGIVGTIYGWQMGNQWYPIALAVLAYPSVWLGGKLYSK